MSERTKRNRVRALAPLWAVTALLLSTAAPPACPAGEPLPVEFKAADGVGLRGHLFGEGTTGVILGHMYPADQSSWFAFARKLAEQGYLALTFDFRGYGESGGEKVISEIDRDMEGAYRFLRLKVNKIFLAGASMGGTAAIRVAADNPTAGVVSLSAPAAFRGLDAREAARKLTAPCLFVAAEGDGSASEAARAFQKAANSPKPGLLVLPGTEHGTQLFDGPNAGKVEEAILKFLKEN
jgi:pimeloyl-ACP methyl ester carboxylesterase